MMLCCLLKPVRSCCGPDHREWFLECAREDCVAVIESGEDECIDHFFEVGLYFENVSFYLKEAGLDCFIHVEMEFKFLVQWTWSYWKWPGPGLLLIELSRFGVVNSMILDMILMVIFLLLGVPFNLCVYTVAGAE